MGFQVKMTNGEKIQRMCKYKLCKYILQQQCPKYTWYRYREETGKVMFNVFMEREIMIGSMYEGLGGGYGGCLLDHM